MSNTLFYVAMAAGIMGAFMIMFCPCGTLMFIVNLIDKRREKKEEAAAAERQALIDHLVSLGQSEEDATDAVDEMLLAGPLDPLFPVVPRNTPVGTPFFVAGGCVRALSPVASMPAPPTPSLTGLVGAGRFAAPQELPPLAALPPPLIPESLPVPRLPDVGFSNGTPATPLSSMRIHTPADEQGNRGAGFSSVRTLLGVGRGRKTLKRDLERGAMVQQPERKDRENPRRVRCICCPGCKWNKGCEACSSGGRWPREKDCDKCEAVRRLFGADREEIERLNRL